ncbi:MAG: hypothetical protein ACYC5G_00795 [Candidatus Doudnabacteria bacterium]
MGDILKFPGKWHGPEIEPDNSGSETNAESETSATETPADVKINIEHAITMLEALTIYMPQKIHSQELIKTYEPLVSGYTDQEIISRINNSDLADWQTKTVFFHCLYKEASRRELINRFGVK